MNPIIPIADAIKRQAARKPRQPEPMTQFRIFIGSHGGATQGKNPAPSVQAAPAKDAPAVKPTEAVNETPAQGEEKTAKKRGRK